MFYIGIKIRVGKIKKWVTLIEISCFEVKMKANRSKKKSASPGLHLLMMLF